MTNIKPQELSAIVVNDNTYLRLSRIARTRNHKPGIDPEPLIDVTGEKIRKDVRAGILKPPTKIGGASLWRWGDIRKAYGLAAPDAVEG